MKICNKCHIEKSVSEFYAREHKCKQCRLLRQSELRQISKNKHDVISIGTKKCNYCNQVKPMSMFTIDRTCKTGRTNKCRSCYNRIEIEKKRKLPIYRKKHPATTPGTYNTIYITASCSICKDIFEKTNPAHSRCDRCSHLALKVVWNKLKQRSGKKPLLTTVNEVVRNYITSYVCIYCGINYSERNPKSFDHIIPVCRGGSSESDNINICCLDCNRAKSGLLLSEWLDLCTRVSKYNTRS